MRKIPRTFLDLSSSLKLSGIDVTTHIHLIYKDNKKLIKSGPNKNTTSAKKDSTSSASEALTEFFLIQIRL